MKNKQTSHNIDKALYIGAAAILTAFFAVIYYCGFMK